MGLYDRDYVRTAPQPRTVGGYLFSTAPVTMWLIVINVAVFLLDPVLTGIFGGYVYRLPFGTRAMKFLEHWGHFSVAFGIYGLQLWRLITFQFLHAGLFHLLFNMLALFFFGPMIERYLSSRRYLAFYLLCGIAGAVAYLILWGTEDMVQMLQMNAFVPLVGASAGIYGVLIGAARVAPDATVLVYGFIPVKLRVMAWLMLGIAVYTVFTSGPNAGGEAAHLGGAVLGWLLIRNPQLLNVFRGRRQGMRYIPD